jgi:hypothetical protein
MDAVLGVPRSVLPSSRPGKVGLEGGAATNKVTPELAPPFISFVAEGQKDVDGRHEAGHDGMSCRLVNALPLGISVSGGIRPF